MNIQPRRLVAWPALFGLVAATPIAVTTALPAGAAAATPPPVIVNGHCTGSSLSNLQLQREDTGKLSIDFGVDMATHAAKVPWKVNETDNGATILSVTRSTIADGSFSVTKMINPQPGSNAVTATAVNAKTGERCTLSASI